MARRQLLFPWLFLAMMVSLDVVLSPLLRIEGMAPMSSVVNILAALLMGPWFTALMAFLCAILRMSLLGIPPLALTGAFFGGLCAGLGARYGRTFFWAFLGEFVGTGLIGSLLSYPVMVWFTGTKTNLFWFVYTPRFVGATLIGGVMAYLVWRRLKSWRMVAVIQEAFGQKWGR